MKKVLVLLTAIAVAAITVASCKKAEDPAIINIKDACVGTWVGSIGETEIEVTFTSAGKISCTPNNFSATITKWYMSGKNVCVELDNSTAKSMIIDVKGTNMYLTTNNAELSKNLPGTLVNKKALK
jgi:hypothetical protein